MSQSSPSPPSSGPVCIIGAGLAGCEVAYQLSRRGVEVELWEQKPATRSPAHVLDGVAELVCSNSLRSDSLTSAPGLLKEELRRTGSGMMRCADTCRVPAGAALAVDRAAFSAEVEQLLSKQPCLRLVRRVADQLPRDDRPTVVATGPLTDGGLARDLATITGAEALHFYDAIAPIVATDSIDREQVFAASRWDRGDAEDYLNLPLDRDTYLRFVDQLLAAAKVTPHGFEDRACFEGCLPIEVMAARGPEVLSHGPMKPVGLRDPRTGQRPHAVVQLRKEDRADQARNLVGFQTRMTQSAQQEILRGLPGLARARFLRYGSIHRNTYLDAPGVLDDQLRLRLEPSTWIAGQLAGTEGYVEAIGCGMLVAWSVLSSLRGEPFDPPPRTTAHGGLYAHLRGSASGKFTPSNITWALIDPHPQGRSKQERRSNASNRALTVIEDWSLRAAS